MGNRNFDQLSYSDMNEPDISEVAKNFFASAFVQFQQQKMYPTNGGGGGGGYKNGGNFNNTGHGRYNNRKY